MFQRLISFIKEVIKRMIPTNSVTQALNTDIAISAPMAEALQLWSRMYANDAHWLNHDVKSLNLPATISGEISRAVTIEMEVEITGSKRADYLNQIMEPIVAKMRQYVEFAVAKGGLMLKPYVANSAVCLDFVQADQFFPVAFDANGNITSCIFSDQRQVGQYYYTRLEYHTMTADGCVIRNVAYRSTAPDALGSAVTLASVPAWAEIEPEATIRNITKPLYAYFRFPMANSIDVTSPLGVSCFSRAVDQIHEADEQWSNLLWEFESGERALYVDVLAFGKDKEGNPKLPKGKGRLYRTLSDINLEGKLYQEWSPEFREASILSGLDAILKKIEFNCGLAQGTISDPSTVALTATEIKMSRQRTYATITDTQKALKNALDQLLYAMDVWTTLYGLAPAGMYDAAYSFDDSIVSDHDTQFIQDTQVVTMNAMPKYVFLMRNYGMSEEQAKKWVAGAQGEQPSLFGTNPQTSNDMSMNSDNSMPDTTTTTIPYSG